MNYICLLQSVFGFSRTHNLAGATTKHPHFDGEPEVEIGELL